MKTKTTSALLITLALLCLRSGTVQAVSPPPDGGYSGGNTAEGQNALSSLTTGGFNVAVGYFSLFANTTGSFNTAIGAGALDLNTASNNTATGAAALLLNTTGTNNTAAGVDALAFNDTGSSNTANGAFVLFSNTIGVENTGTGASVLYSNTTGSHNTATGAATLYGNTVGTDNTANGHHALESNMTGSSNTATGRFALGNNSSGSNNTALGDNAGTGVTTASNVICIGAGVGGANVNDSCYIGNISGAGAIGGDAVFITGAGKLGTIIVPSAARFKEEIKPMNTASEVLYTLKPVTFRYKQEFDPQGIPQFGLVAEEVEKANPDLVKRDRDGKLQTVRYDAVNAMLLNEFLKEHATVQELKREIAALNASLKEQAAQIEKVTAKVDIAQAASQGIATTR